MTRPGGRAGYSFKKAFQETERLFVFIILNNEQGTRNEEQGMGCKHIHNSTFLVSLFNIIVGASCPFF
jgi:hypothetical protein